LRDKAKGKEIVAEEPDQPAPVTDLLAALQASLERGNGRKAARTGGKRRSRARKSA
jgi:non-homologous end joining protein Ku